MKWKEGKRERGRGHIKGIIINSGRVVVDDDDDTAALMIAKVDFFRGREGTWEMSVEFSFPFLFQLS